MAKQQELLGHKSKAGASDKQQANRYDKIFKENLLKAIHAVLHHVVGVSAAYVQPLQVELQHTRERKADFIGLITDLLGHQQVLHIEFQVRNDRKMLQRMLEYRTMLRRKYPGLRILQFVVFLGKNPPTMRTETDEPDLTYRYHIRWMQNIDCRKFLDSERAEEVLLAVLADFGTAAPAQVANEIVKKLKAKSKTDLDFQRFTEQLRILSNIRNLQPLIEIIMEKVSRFFVEERDPLYKKGKLEGKQEGKLEGKLEGELAKTKKFVQNLLDDGSYTIEKICVLADVSEEFVLKVKAEMEAEKKAKP
jgi:predicted transposase YdaD